MSTARAVRADGPLARGWPHLPCRYTGQSHRLRGDVVHPPLGLDGPPAFVVRAEGDACETRMAVGLTDTDAPLPIGPRRMAGAAEEGGDEVVEGAGEADMADLEYELAAAREYRQSFFPRNLIVEGVGVRIEAGKASVPADAAAILNAIVAHHTRAASQWRKQSSSDAISNRRGHLRDVSRHRTEPAVLTQPPPQTSEAYDEYNMMIQAHFAPAAIERALLDTDPKVLERVIKTLRVSRLTVLRISLRNSRSTEIFESAIKGLPGAPARALGSPWKPLEAAHEPAYSHLAPPAFTAGCLALPSAESLQTLEVTIPDALYKTKRAVRDDADAATWHSVAVFEHLTTLALRQMPLQPDQKEKLSRVLQPPEVRLACSWSGGLACPPVRALPRSFPRLMHALARPRAHAPRACSHHCLI